MTDTNQPQPPETRHRHEEKRWGVLGAAIMEFVQAGLPIDTEWVAEYNELTERAACQRESRELAK